MKAIKLFIIFACVSLACCKSRQKRAWWIWWNPYSESVLGLIVSIPFSIFLPGLVQNGRSLNQLNNNTNFIINDQYTMQPQYEDQVSKLLNIFSFLQINSIACQEALICLVRSNEKEYSPLSDLILKELKCENGPIKKDKNSYIWRYMTAFKHGYVLTVDQCVRKYSECPGNPRRILHSAFMKMWSYLSTTIDLKIV